MKCFLVYVKDWTYDEFDSVVVLADSEEEVRSMFKRERDFRGYGTSIGGIFFNDGQGEIFIKEIKEKGVVLASFNAG